MLLCNIELRRAR